MVGRYLTSASYLHFVRRSKTQNETFFGTLYRYAFSVDLYMVWTNA